MKIHSPLKTIFTAGARVLGATAILVTVPSYLAPAFFIMERTSSKRCGANPEAIMKLSHTAMESDLLRLILIIPSRCQSPTYETLKRNLPMRIFLSLRCLRTTRRFAEQDLARVYALVFFSKALEARQQLPYFPHINIIAFTVYVIRFVSYSAPKPSRN